MTTATFSGSPAVPALSAYCSVADVKAYLGISGAGDDSLLTSLIARAQSMIDRYCNRTFAYGAATARSIDVERYVAGGRLFLPWDLCSITSVVNDADNSAPVTLVSGTDYLPYPRYETPYYALDILPNSAKYWTYTYNPQNGVTVTGKWAYSEAAPDGIAHACIRLTGYLYHQKDAQVFDVTAQPDAGVITIPQGIPKDVRLLLDMYVRIT